MAHRTNRATAALIIATIIVSACSGALTRPLPSSQTEFFNRWQALCGAQFEGQAVFPEPASEEFRGKLLVATVASCSTTQIRIPFSVGDDRSRTWVLSRTEQERLLLKHDHRHADGSPDEISNYGGFAESSGSDRSQSFPADSFTAKLIPEAATNVWQISLSEDSSELVYYLERHGQPRFRAEFKRTR